jgi:hypothetical protein
VELDDVVYQGKRNEAAVNGIKYFYDGMPCVKGHDTGRYTTTGDCIECRRLNDSGIKRSEIETLVKKAAKKSKVELKQEAEAALAAKAPSQRLQLTDDEKQKVLDCFSQYGRKGKAALAIGITESQLEARLVADREFGQMFASLEKRVTAKNAEKESTTKKDDYEWTDEKRDAFIDHYVDTGDIAAAREKIGVTPSKFNREIKRNPDFAEAVREAAVEAVQMLEEKAIQLALVGNDKLLPLTLKAKKRTEYGDKLQLTDDRGGMTDDQLEAQLRRLVGKYKNRVQPASDGEFVALERPDAGRQVALIEDTRGDREEGAAEQIPEPVSDDWLL